MFSILVAFTIFFTLFIFHVLFFRLYIDKGIDIKKITFWLFFLGLLPYIICHFLNSSQDNFFYSGMLLYVSLVMLHFIFFLNPYLKDRSPSSEIIRLLVKRKSATRLEIMSQFDNNHLINKRINDLLMSGYITRVKGAYYPTMRGTKLSTLITKYTKFMKWEKGG